jgi:ABC-2 type transport system ATP-binding protein
LRRFFGGADPAGDRVAGERGVSRRLRLIEGERREAGRVPDAPIRRVRGAMIEVEDISKSFGTTRALAGVDMSVPAGTVQGLLGPNGAGKTTLVRILATLLAPDTGQARISGVDVQKDPNTVRSLIGLAGLYAAVDETLTGRENLVMVGRLYRLGAKLAKTRAGESLERLGLAEAADRPVKTYSGGMRRRLDLGASLVGRPRVLILDEPTTGLDPRTRLDMWAFIRDLVAEGTTVLLTTQYLEEADQLADHSIVIDRGQVIASGTSAELKARLGSDLIAVQVRAAELDRVPVESMTKVAARNIAPATTGEPPSSHKEFGEMAAICMMDPRDNGVLILADHMLPPRKGGVMIPGPEVHAMKLAFEKYYLWKSRHGMSGCRDMTAIAGAGTAARPGIG